MSEEKKAQVSRRELLKLAALGGSGFYLSACADAAGLEIDGEESELSRPLFVGGLTTSLHEELRYRAQVQGRLPRDLQGTLYKNGPGLFERAGVRRRTLLDGDGMITAYRFEHGRVEFQNRYVQTPKLQAEQAAGRFLYNSWTTRVPDGLPDADQAGVTVWPWNGKLYAFDEGHPGWELEPRDLRTNGQATFGLPHEQASVFAHGKQLAGGQEFNLFGIEYGSLQYNYISLDRAGRVRDRRSLPVTDYGPPSYVHDWFVTPQYFVVHVMPALIDGEAFVAGGGVLRDALRWHGEMPSRMLVFRRDQVGAPQIFELEAAWMWHSGNAFERGDELVLDWIGYDDPYHFVGQGAEWERVMSGELLRTGAEGVLRRTVLNLRTGRASSQRFDELIDQEFPFVSPNVQGQPSRYVYFVHEPGDGPLYQAVGKVDLESGKSDVFDFGPGRYALEPVFVPRGRAEDDGYLLVETANANSGRTELHVLDARRLADGPIATVRLRQHVPMRFHGRFAPR